MTSDSAPNEHRPSSGGPGHREDAEEEQEKEARRSRATGGDAPAAASIEEREAVAQDRDDLFTDPDDTDDQGDQAP